MARPKVSASAEANAAAPRWRRRAANRPQEILDAALTVFSARGFAAAKLDDVAKEAGVSKGTLYLYFKDKEALFEALVRGAVTPMLDKVGAFAAAPGMRAGDVLRFFFATFEREVLGTKRKLLVRLILAEGPRFPALAEFYYREVIARVLEAVRAMLRRAVERGELKDDTLVKHPQLLAAPGIMAIIWSGLFDRFEPLDIRSLMQAHFEMLFGKEGAP